MKIPIASGTLPVSSLFGCYVVPLYGFNEWNDPFVRGTGFYVHLSPHFYLVSAKHVFDEIHMPGGVWINPARSEFMQLRGLQLHSGKTMQVEQDDQLDLIVTQMHADMPKPPFISNEGQNMFINIHALEWGHLKSRELPRRLGVYHALGYPQSKNQINHSRRFLQSNLFSYSGISPGSAVYKELKVDEYKNILIIFDQKSAKGNIGNNIPFPNPQGMSGGPIINFTPNFKNVRESEFYVTGVVTERVRDRLLIRGTDIRYVKQMIEILHSGGVISKTNKLN